MRLIQPALFVFALSMLVSLALTLAVRAVAPRLGLVDRPDGRRKLHQGPIALGGGLAVFLSTLSIVLLLMCLPVTPESGFQTAQTSLWNFGHELLALLAAGAVIVTVGLIDDRVRIRGRLKLCGQIVAAAILTAGGLLIQRVVIFGIDFQLGPLAVPFTIFWFLGAINAMNLLDGIDGLATSLGMILVATIAAMSFLVHNDPAAIIALAFAGSLMGFLRYNFPPATIFLGDAGSMLIGMVVGSLAIGASLKGPGTVLLMAPLAVWTIPIFDSAAAIIRRKLTGRSIYTTDRGHLHHRLLDLLGSNRRVLACVACFCAVTSGATLVSVAIKSDLVALLACSAIVVMLIATGIFGRAELALVTNRLRKFSLSLFETPGENGKKRVRQSAVRLQGTRHWESVWKSLTEAAGELGLIGMALDVNLPRAQEGYHGTWECAAADEHAPRWRMEIPLLLQGQLVGHLHLTGEPSGNSARNDLEQVFVLLEPLEAKLRTLVDRDVATLVPVGVGATVLSRGDDESLTLLAQQHPK